MMAYDFVITLKKERRNSIDVISVILILLSVVAFLTVSSRSGFTGYLLLIVSIILIFGLLRAFYLRRRSQKITFGFWLTAAGITWVSMPFTAWVSIPVIILAFLEKPAKMPVVIGFNAEGVSVRNLFRRNVTWESFNNVMLKDGILTLDFKNNRILQKSVTDELPEPDEIAFNDYCRRHLSSGSKLISDHNRTTINDR